MSTSNIVKATVTLTVFLERDELRDLYQMDIDSIAREMDTGDWIGSPPKIEWENVPPHMVKRELVAIGNDGGFFDN